MFTFWTLITYSIKVCIFTKAFRTYNFHNIIFLFLCKDNNYIENSNFKISNESNNNKTTMGFFDSSWYQGY